MTELTHSEDKASLLNTTFPSPTTPKLPFTPLSLAALGPDPEILALEQRSAKPKCVRKSRTSPARTSSAKAQPATAVGEALQPARSKEDICDVPVMLSVHEPQEREVQSPAAATGQTNGANLLLNKLINRVKTEAEQPQNVTVIEDFVHESAVQNELQAEPAQPALQPTSVAEPESAVAEFRLSPEEKLRLDALKLKEGDVCPHCHQGVLVQHSGQHADFLGCSHFPSCNFRYFLAKTSTLSTLRVMESKCPICQGPLAVKRGRFGIFIACLDYPQCNYSYKEQQRAAKEAIPCPLCHKGQLEERRNRRGSIFYGCNHYPNCKFALSGEAIKETCPDCGFPVLYRKRTKTGIKVKCGNSLCKFSRQEV